MTDKKFTDDEIIKAYELCFTPAGTTKTCAKCPFHTITLCKIERDRAALDLLHRQKAQIIKEQNKNSKLRNERNHLKAEIDDLRRDTVPKLQNGLERANYYGLKADEEIEHLKAEIERLQAVHADMTESLRLAAEANKDMSVELDAMRSAANSYKMHYENAIKEFAERLKLKFRIKYTHSKPCEDLIDILVKEMTEETK